MHTKGSVVYIGQPAAGDLGAEGTFFVTFFGIWLILSPAEPGRAAKQSHHSTERCQSCDDEGWALLIPH